uniref:Uncharacterized protein n=1 Tax=Solanum lycopersicum TaxID=4081 RepID=A0A3Q7FPH0_SOLLC
MAATTLVVVRCRFEKRKLKSADESIRREYTTWVEGESRVCVGLLGNDDTRQAIVDFLDEAHI